MPGNKIERELLVKTSEAVVSMLHVLGAGLPGTKRMVTELLALRNLLPPLSENEDEPEGYTADEMREVLKVLAAMTFNPNNEDKKKARGILDQARAKGLL